MSLASTAAPHSDDYAARFGGIARLFGSSALARLRNAHVCIVGLGGVGSWAAEALVRSGLGAIDLIDLDDVCVTNVNRQLPAMDGAIGLPKVDVLTHRIKAISPECCVTAIPEFFTTSSAQRLLSIQYDFLIDAIDKLTNKCVLISSCRLRSIPVLTVGAAGGKRDGTAVRVSDLADSVQDELLRQVRHKLRRDHGFPTGVRTHFGVPCVYSPEKPVFPWANGETCAKPEPGSKLSLDCATGFGTASFVTGAFGFAAAGEVVRRIATGVRS